MKEILVRQDSTKIRHSALPFENKLPASEDSIMNKTFTLDTNKRERMREFCIEDAIRGFLPRARSSGPRRITGYNEDVTRRVRSETSSLFSATCKLPSLDNFNCEKKTCTLRPWSRTQEELRQYKETLQNINNGPATKKVSK